MSASDILAKLYLNAVDHNLRAQGFEHYRYVDDFRIFCRDRTEAKKALAELTKLLWRRGLSLQGAKSEIVRADDARDRIEGVLPVLKSVAHGFVQQVRQTAGLGDAYMSIARADQILLDNPERAPLEVIRDAYKTYFIESSDERFDHTLFRFLLNRLGRHGDAFAVQHCIRLLERHPQESRTILDYVAAADSLPVVQEEIVRFLQSGEAVYPYQVYQIVEWFAEEAGTVSADLLGIIRRLAFDMAEPAYLRSVARQFVGRFGEIADLERLVAACAEAPNAVEQCEIICCTGRLERVRRNAFLARAAGDGEPNRRAVAWVQAQDAAA